MKNFSRENFFSKSYVILVAVKCFNIPFILKNEKHERTNADNEYGESSVSLFLENSLFCFLALFRGR